MIVAPPFVTKPQYFIVRGWLDAQEWGDEPPDPDDVWAVGDRVRLKGSTVEGTVHSSEEYPFLGGYLTLILVWWDEKPIPIPVEPELLIRINRYIPLGLTWKAPQSFSDERSAQEKVMSEFQIGDTVAPGWPAGRGRRGKIVNVISKNQFEVDWADSTTGKVRGDQLLLVTSAQGKLDLSESGEIDMVANVDSKFLPGQEVYVRKGHKRIKRVVGDSVGTGKNYGKILTVGGRSGREEYWEEVWKLEAVTPPSVRVAQENEATQQDNENVVSQQDSILEKVYSQLTDADVWVTVQEIYQDLGCEYAILEIMDALQELQAKGEAKSKLDTNRKEAQLVWQKDIPAIEAQSLPEKSSPSTPIFKLAETSQLEATLEQLKEDSVRLRSLVEKELPKVLSEELPPPSPLSITSSSVDERDAQVLDNAARSLNNDEQRNTKGDTIDFTWMGPGRYWISAALIKTDLGTQCRIETDKATVAYYASQMESDLWEWEASPVRLLWDGHQLIPYDGHHRLEAAAAARQLILAIIDEGNLERAIALSCGSNKKPSLRRTQEDNRKTIGMLQELRSLHGDDWLLNIINADLPEDKQFKHLSLRALEAYTGIPFSTIRDVEKKIKTKGESSGRVTFTPSDSEWDVLAAIMDSEGLEKPSEAIKWLIQNFEN